MLRSTALALALFLAAPLSLSAAAQARHDFDWNFGTWHTHISRLVQRPTGSIWVSYDGAVTVRPLLDGSSNVEEVDAQGPSRLQFIAIRTFNAKTNQWILNQGDSTGAFGQQAFGRFSGRRGTFYDVETIDNRAAIVRQTFFDITNSSYAFEQAFSSDGGRTWTPNFRARLRRTSSRATVEGRNGALSHDFDFNYGTWRTNIRYLRGPLRSDTWGVQAGTVRLRRLWNGDGMLEEIVASGPDAFSGITLYLYDPSSREWSQTYIDGSDGTADPSMVGSFSGGRAALLSQSRYNGELVAKRGVWTDITPNAHHFEIDVSDDGGQSWHPVFVAALTRLGPGV